MTDTAMPAGAAWALVRAAQPSATIKLSDRERKALISFADADLEFGYRNFKAIAIHSGLPACDVRRTVRALARKGLTKYGRGLWTEDGEPAGAGYALTDEGRKQMEAILGAVSTL